MMFNLKPTQHDQMLGRQLGGYTITRCVGKGGMGIVYEAKHQRMSQRAAIKVLNQALSADLKVLQRFFNEAKALSLVQHASIVKVIEFGQLDDGNAFIMMEFLDGDPLSSCLTLAQQEGRGLPLALVVELGKQIAAALATSHEKGVVHRDLKPENVFIVPDPVVACGQRVKLLDFGIAKFLEGEARKTTIGMILGTPLYMAPEQCEGSQKLDAKVDVYSLGVMLYEMIAGRLPFDADSTAAIMRQHLFKEPPALAEQRAEIPVALTALVHRMLAKLPGERPTMPEVFAALDDFLPPGDQSSRGLRQEFARHMAVHQHIVLPDDGTTDPLAPTLGSPPLETVTPVRLLSATPVAVVRTSRLPIFFGTLLMLALALVTLRLRPNRSLRAAALPIATNSALVPIVAPKGEAAVLVLDATPKSDPLENAEHPADSTDTTDSAAAKSQPQENSLEEQKRRPKGARPRAPALKSTDAGNTNGAPARAEEDPEQAWR